MLSTTARPKEGESLIGSASLSARFAALFARHEWLFVLAVVAIWSLVRAWYALRPLWFDELFTFYIARQPHLAQIFRALPADGNPPLYYLLARISMGLLGPTEFALRLPALIGFAGAALAVYVYIRARGSAVFALFGMLLLLSSPMASYGSEARSYSLMLGFAGLALVSWRAAAAGKHRRGLALVGVAAGIAGAIASHHYGVVQVGIALLFGESVRIYEQRRLDIPLYCAAAGGLSMLAFTLPLVAAANHVMLNYVRQAPEFWARPGIRSMLSYRAMLAAWIVPVFFVLCWFTRRVAPIGEGEHRRIPLREIAPAIGLALMVPIVILLTSVTTRYFMDRYAIGAAMGIALLAGLAMPALGRTRVHAPAVAAICALAMLAVLISRPLLSVALHGTEWRVAPSSTADSVLGGAPGTDPIVIASALEYLPDYSYAPPPLRTRLHYLADLPFAVRQPDFLPEVSLVSDQMYLPCKADDFRQFIATHRRFLVYSVGMPRLEWTVSRLKKASWSLTPIRREGDLVLYRAEAPS